MSVYIHSIETKVPPYSRTQEQVSEFMQAQADSDRARRLIKKVYSSSGIYKRHSVLPDFTPGAQSLLFHEDEQGRINDPLTGERNAIFADEAPKLIIPAAQEAIRNAPAITKDDITHVITVSCTGFYNPGPDYQLIRDLGLGAETQRYNIGFMGCYAAFPALKMAKQFCAADPEAVVLIVCYEICSLHISFSNDLDAILSNSLFADGAAAAIVSARKPGDGQSVLELNSFSSTLIPESEDQMAWKIGNHGFDIILSTYVPRILGSNVPEEVGRLLSSVGRSPDDIDVWAIHPGGRSIVDKLESAMELLPEQVQYSRKVLSENGNMSSPTILFVLRDIMHNGNGTSIMAMAFGPGLTMESGLMERVTVASGKPDVVNEVQEALLV